jgi:putative endonuclease
MYWVYILQSASGRYYVGSTVNLERRIEQHNTHKYPGSEYTKRAGGPWELVYSEVYETRKEAMMREKQIKRWKSRKAIEQLIESKIAGNRN